MSVRIIVGAQWGDEGKGKIVDLLGANCDVVARYQGGANAGHTVVVNGEQIILHLIPSGILHPHVMCYIGNGAVVDPDTLLQEIELLESRNIQTEGRLFVSGNAHVIFPYHKILERKIENKPNRFLGTTLRGIGPAYTDKVDRIGIRMEDLLHPEALRRKISTNLEAKAALLGEDGPGLDNVFEEYASFGATLKKLIKDVSLLLTRDISAGKEILLEGAQGTLLDVDFGTYPYVTSCNPIAGNACTGLGIGPSCVDSVMGIMKAYSTRVGEGPFPTEFDAELNEKMRNLGQEFGATTGRARRCGWFDGVLARFAKRVNGLTELAITKLDVLDSLDEIKICTAYRMNGDLIRELPMGLSYMQNCEPVYESLPGWREETSRVRSYAELPENARTYVEKIVELSDVPVRLISVGSERNQTIFVE